MISEKMLRKYASLSVRTGVNVQKGQLLVIRSQVDTAYFARLCAEEAYLAGAGRVEVKWMDEMLTKIAFEHEHTDSMKEVFPWEIQREQDYVDRKFAYLAISAQTPGLLGGIPGDKLQAVELSRRTAFEPFDYYHMENRGQWSIVGIPTPDWAKKAFPDLDPDSALKKLWESVLMSVRITEDNDPVAEWREHNARLEEHCARLNAMRLRALHFQNEKGTDLTVPLVENHVWVGGGSRMENGVIFNPNMPTEEVFCMPEKRGAQGIVYATKPLNYQGKMIRDFWFRFENGGVVDYGAEEGAEVLKNLVEFDEGSRFPGEVALIPYDSPISKSGVLFLNTLFDENASCHLALGDAYPENVKGGVQMSRAELEACGANHSKEHCDFMFGSADMRVDGITAQGGTEPVFINGNFVF